MDDRGDVTVHCQSECFPLNSLDELLLWCDDGERKYLDSDLKCYQVPLLKCRNFSVGPKIIHCHDMKGGYLEDRFHDGHSNLDAYRFYYWSLIDIFIYFSHHFITIPPIGWICSAHRNGVLCFGTIIIEKWAKYSDISAKQFISMLLVNKERIDLIIQALVNIRKHYHFDGWFVNIETPIPKDKIPLMKYFLETLSLEMHKQVNYDNQACVIWYDSVVCDDGSLTWQNELNHRNKPFFDCCDGIFLNYNWDAAKLLKSKVMAGDRKYDVYVGIDVFGRGCIGGGGFNSKVALKLILEADLSVAIFAPGWCHEVLGQENFKENEYKFWSELVSGGLGLNERYFTELPLKSSFCQGFGQFFFKNGEKIHSECWFDLKQQQLQPCFNQSGQYGLLKITNCTTDSYNGGGCLQLLFDIKHDTPKVTLFLTHTKVSFQNENFCLLKYTVVYKTIVHSVKLINKISFKKLFNDELQTITLSLNEDSFLNENFESNKASTTENDWTKDQYTIKVFNTVSDQTYWISGIDIQCNADDNLDDHFNLLIGHLCLEIV